MKREKKQLSQKTPLYDKTSIIVLAAAAAVFLLVLFWIHSEDILHGAGKIFWAYGDELVEFEKGTVLEIESQDMTPDETAEGAYRGNQKLSVKVGSGQYKGEVLTVSNDFGRVSYTEAVEILKKSGKKFDYPVEWGIDLQTEHERYLTEEVFKKPIFVTNYPKEIKAFYMRLNDDGKTVAAADCLVPGIGEIIGGSQREERLEVLEQRMDELGLKKEDYWWYLDLRRYGTCRHAGYGLGFERMVMYLTGVSNIRDVELHPRTTGNADF